MRVDSAVKSLHARANSNSAFLPYILLSLILAVVFYVRIRLLAIPLERDEGEFAFMGQLLLKGISPFADIYTMKLPGVCSLYALFMFLFGKTTVGIHAGLLVVNGISSYLLYLLTKTLFGSSSTAICACSSYAVLSLSSSVLGLYAHATHFVVFFALLGFLLLHYSLNTNNHSRSNRSPFFLFICGIFLGMAITMKQHAAILVIFSILYYIFRILNNPTVEKKIRINGGALFLLGIIVPYLLVCLWMVTVGHFDTFWFWTFQYAREYTSNETLTSGWNHFKSSFTNIVKLQWPLWTFAGLGLISLFTKKNDCSDRPFILGFLLFSFLMICPGLYFREHYFILLLPAVAIMSGAGINLIARFWVNLGWKLKLYIPSILTVVAIAYCLYNEKDIFFSLTPREITRANFGVNPFPEALEIASYLKNNTDPNDKIAILGSEPEIYFYADRPSASGYIYMYGLMENQPYAKRMQTQMIDEVEEARPKYIVFVTVNTSWLVNEFSILSVLKWGKRYLHDLYDRVGVIDILDSKTTLYIWDDRAAHYSPVSKHFVTVFKRKSGV